MTSFREGRRKLAELVGAAGFILLVLGPLAQLAGEALRLAWAGELPWDLLLPRGRRLILFGQSGLFAALTAAGALLVALILVSYGWRWSSRPLYRRRWALAALALIPPVVHGFLWTSIGGTVNGLLALGGLAPVRLQGWTIAGAAELTWFLPFALGIVTLATDAIDRSYVEAARLFGRDWHAALPILLRLARPVLLAGFGLLMVLGMCDYTIPSLFQVNVYALEVFSEFSATNSPVNALLLAVPSIALCSGLMVMVVRTVQAHSFAQAPGGWKAGLLWPRGFRLVQGLTVWAVGGWIVLALGTLVADAGGVTGLLNAGWVARGELIYSIRVAGLGALLGLVPACAVAALLADRPSMGRLVGWLLFLPIAIPAPLAGIALIQFWNRPGLDLVYETAFLPALAATMRTLPWAVVLIWMTLKRIDPGLLEAARLLEGRPGRRWFQIRFPLLFPGLLAALGLLFVCGMGELGATLLVLPPGHSTLTVRLYNYLHYGAADRVAGLTLWTVLVSTVVGLAVVALLLFGRRLAWGGSTDDA